MLGKPANHTSHSSQGKGSQGNPIRPIRDYSGLLGLLRAYWVALAPLGLLDPPDPGPSLRPQSLAPLAPKTLTVDSEKLEDGYSMIYAVFPSFFGLGLEDNDVLG